MSVSSRELPDGWIVPAQWTSYGIGRCKSCHALVAWCVTQGGHRAPVDRDGRSHFSTCPDASYWRNRSKGRR